jgi:hypothetical protein
VAIKSLVPLTTLPTANEQSAVVPITVTATGVSREYPELGAFSKAVFLLDVSAASGTTPNLTAKVQGYNPLADKWHDVAAFPAQTAATGAGAVLAPINANLDYENYRASWTVTGTTPSFTFTLCAIAHTEEPITRTW